MRRSRIAFSLIAGVVTVTLSGCGFNSEEREPWRAKEEARCLSSGAVVPSSFIQPMKEIKGPRICGVTYPFKVSALAGGTVPLSSAVPLSCSMIPALENWVRNKVQPAAYMHFGMPVTEIKVMGSYNCRTMNSRKGASWSEHAFSNALDVSGFTLLDGRTIDIKKHWKGGTPAEQTFLRDTHGSACDHFKTVLGPGADSFHYDHFHLDLRMHDPRGARTVCRPRPNVTPSPYPEESLPMVRNQDSTRPLPPAPIEVARAPMSYPPARQPAPLHAPVAAPAPAPIYASAPSHGPASYSPAPVYAPPQPYPVQQPQHAQPQYEQPQLAAAPAPQQPSGSDPIGMWLNQSDPYVAAPAPAQPLFPSQGPSGIY